ncbi:MAG: hypothetical protein ABW121_18945 [Candidatus Thiodiazotropha sp. 6PLUC7]
MNDHNEINSVFDYFLSVDPSLIIILLFLVSTFAGIFRYTDKTITYAVYHFLSSIVFLITWMIFCVHIVLDSFYALLGLAIGSYLGPITIDMAVSYLLDGIKSKIKMLKSWFQ